MLDVTTTSSETTITSKVQVGRQLGAVGLCAVLVAVAFMQPVEQRFVCRDDDRCELTTRRLVGREVIHIGSASRVSSVEVPRKTRTTSRSRRHRTLLELTAPAESIAVERRIGTEIRTWLTQGTVVDGVRLPPRATPFHAEDSTSGVIFVVLFVCAAGALAFGARQFVQVELEKRGMQADKGVGLLAGQRPHHGSRLGPGATACWPVGRVGRNEARRRALGRRCHLRGRSRARRGAASGVGTSRLTRRWARR